MKTKTMMPKTGFFFSLLLPLPNTYESAVVCRRPQSSTEAPRVSEVDKASFQREKTAHEMKTSPSYVVGVPYQKRRETL